MRQLAERAYFLLCLTLGRLLRSAKYSNAQIVDEDEGAHVRKRRSFYAPLLIWMSGPLVRLLDTGLRVLPQHDWEERERHLYQRLYNTSIRIEANGTLVFPRFAGDTLATLLEDPTLEEAVRKTAIERAVVALVEFHRLGLTHGDAMAENVTVDAPRPCSGRPEPSSKGEACVARWIDFETLHESSRPVAWRRADDLRALIVTCLVRTAPAKLAETLDLVLDVYEDDDVLAVLATNFASVWRRSLTFHLAQAALSFWCFREIARLLRERLGVPRR